MTSYLAGRHGVGVAVGLLLAIVSPRMVASPVVQEAPAYALIKGTVFNSLGRSFPGVEIRVERIDVDEKDRKKWRQERRSDRIGEFAFRVPPGPSKYELTFRAKDFEIEKREIEVIADERVGLTVLLRPEG